MSEENSINIRAGRKSSRPSVAAKMSQLASDKGDISYDSVLRIVGEEIDAEKKSKMLLRTSLLLLFSLLAVTAANAGLTFAVVEFAKDTKVDGGVMTSKDSTEAVKVASTDFTMVDGRMVSREGTPSVIATAAAAEDMTVEGMLTFASESEIDALGDIDSVTIETETGTKNYKIQAYEMADDFASIKFTTADGSVMSVATIDGTVEFEDQNGRKLLAKKYRNMRFMASSKRRLGGRPTGAESSRFLQSKKSYKAKKQMATGFARKHQDSVKSWNGSKNKGSAAQVDYTAFDMRIVNDRVVFLPKGRRGLGGGSGSLEKAAVYRTPASKRTYDRETYQTRYSVTVTYIQGAPVWSHDLPNAVPFTCEATVSGEGFEASDGTTTYDCWNVGMHSFLSLSGLGFDSVANDVWGVSTGGSDYVAIGSYNHCTFVDVTDPNNPAVMDTLAFSSDSSSSYSGSSIFGTSMWADIKAIGSTFYIVNQRQNSHIWEVDATQFANYNNNLATNDYAPSNYTGSHNIQIYANNLYTFYNSGSLGWYDCAAYDFGVMIHSTSGSSVGCISRSSGGDMHDAAFFNYSGTSVGFFAAGQEYATRGTSMWNVSNASSPSFISNVPFTSAIGGGQYAHQPSLNAAGSLMIVTDEWDEFGFNYSGTTTGAKMVLRTWTVSATGASNANTINTQIDANDHQGYMHDDYYFLATWNSGLMVFDVAGAALGSRVGFFDTEDDPSPWGFSGAWSVFVFPYNSCNPDNVAGGGNTYYKVAISDRAGLFMVQPDFHTGSATACSSADYPWIPVYTYGYGSGSGSGR